MNLIFHCFRALRAAMSHYAHFFGFRWEDLAAPGMPRGVRVRNSPSSAGHARKLWATNPGMDGKLSGWIISLEQAIASANP